MVLSVQSRASAGGTGSSGTTITSTSFTPRANAKLYVCFWGQRTVAGSWTVTPTDSGPGFTYTQVDTALGASSFPGRVYVWEVADTGSSPAAMTVTLTPSASAWMGYAIFDVTGDNVQVKAAQHVGNVQGDGYTGAGATSSTGTLPAAVTNGNVAVIFAGANRDSHSVLNAPAGWTTLTNPTFAGYEGVAVFYRTDFTSTSTTYSNASDNEDYGNILFEIEEAGPPPVILGLLTEDNRALLDESSNWLLADA